MGFLNGWFSAVCNSTARLDGKTAIITGCNTGIGKVTAQDFFERGARVIMACRSQEKAKKALEDIKDATKSKENLGELVIEELDLMSLNSVRECAKRLNQQEKRIDLLVNNAGVMVCPEGRTEDNFEIQFGTNHLGHFLFTMLLLPKIIKSAPARIVNVSSMAHSGVDKIDFDDLSWEKRPYHSIRAYGTSKLANILFTKDLARRLKEAKVTGVTVYSLHPGVIATDLSRHISSTIGRPIHWFWDNIAAMFIKTPEQGAQTTIYCSVDEKCANESGLYYAECKIKKPTKAAQNEEQAKQLYEVSLKMVGLPENYDFLQGN